MAGKSLIKFDGKSFFLHNKSTGLAEDTYQPMHADSKGTFGIPEILPELPVIMEKKKLNIPLHRAFAISMSAVFSRTKRFDGLVHRTD